MSCYRTVTLQEAKRYIQSYWETQRLEGETITTRRGKLAKLSAGFYALALALTLCGEVDIYGYTGASGHYYDKAVRIMDT